MINYNSTYIEILLICFLTFIKSNDPIPIDFELETSIWKPIIKFDNVISKTDNSGKIKDSIMWFNTKNSRIEHVKDFVLTIFCNFEFKNFPFDVQECNLTYFDMLSPAEEVKFMKPSKNAKVKKFPGPFGYQMIALDPYLHPYENSSYSKTGFIIKMKRKPIKVLITGYFFPTGAYASISIISFLINPETVRK